MTVREQAQHRLDNLREQQQLDRMRMLDLIGELAELREDERSRAALIGRTEVWIARHDAWVAAGRPAGPRHVTGRPGAWSDS